MFYERLQKAMKERNVSQIQLSAMSGIGKSSISQYVSGKHVPTNKGMQKLADALEVDVDYFNAKTDCPLPSFMIKKVTVAQAAKVLGKSKQFIRMSLQSGTAPFGFAVKPTGKKWSYHISPKKFYEYAEIA